MQVDGKFLCFHDSVKIIDFEVRKFLFLVEIVGSRFRSSGKVIISISHCFTVYLQYWFILGNKTASLVLTIHYPY